MREDIFPLYKPKGPTSRYFLNAVQKISGMKKCGHAGTLDPLAEGVLVVGCGKGTKGLFLDRFSEKQYFGVIKLGEFSDTDDAEGKKSKVTSSCNPSVKEIEQTLIRMKGSIQQEPPLFSAIKIKGKEAYKLARQGSSFSLKKRTVTVKSIDLVSYEYPFLTLRTVTGPGVYIRSLARDIGKSLSCGGYLYNLKRERVGDFRTEDCLNFENGKILPLKKTMFVEDKKI